MHPHQGAPRTARRAGRRSLGLALVTGAVAGAAVALFCAPSRGTDLRAGARRVTARTTARLKAVWGRSPT